MRKIDASRPMSDLDDEAQAKIAEMMYNDRQKKLGRPQTHEEVMDIVRVEVLRIIPELRILRLIVLRN